MSSSRRSYAQQEAARARRAHDVVHQVDALELDSNPCSIRTLADLRRAMAPDALDGFGTVRGRFTGEA